MSVSLIIFGVLVLALMWVAFCFAHLRREQKQMDRENKKWLEQANKRYEEETARRLRKAEKVFDDRRTRSRSIVESGPIEPLSKMVYPESNNLYIINSGTSRIVESDDSTTFLNTDPAFTFSGGQSGGGGATSDWSRDSVVTDTVTYETQPDNITYTDTSTIQE